MVEHTAKIYLNKTREQKLAAIQRQHGVSREKVIKAIVDKRLDCIWDLQPHRFSAKDFA